MEFAPEGHVGQTSIGERGIGLSGFSYESVPSQPVRRTITTCQAYHHNLVGEVGVIPSAELLY